MLKSANLALAGTRSWVFEKVEGGLCFPKGTFPLTYLLPDVLPAQSRDNHQIFLKSKPCRFYFNWI